MTIDTGPNPVIDLIRAYGSADESERATQYSNAIKMENRMAVAVAKRAQQDATDKLARCRSAEFVSICGAASIRAQLEDDDHTGITLNRWARWRTPGEQTTRAFNKIYLKVCEEIGRLLNVSPHGISLKPETDAKGDISRIVIRFDKPITRSSGF